MKRLWSDGQTREDNDPLAVRERAQVNALGIRISNLRMENEWLEAQIEHPWRIENYREACKTPRGIPRVLRAFA